MSLNQVINILQTLLTILMTVVPPILLALGCTQIGNELDCSQAILSPKTLALVVTGIGVVKTTILPWLAPGGWLRNLFGDKAVIAPAASKAAVPGTVAPADVR